MKLKIILFLYIATLINAQPFRVSIIPTTASISDIDLGILTVGDTSNSSLVISHALGYNPFIIDSVTVNGNTTLLPNTSIVTDAERFATVGYGDLLSSWDLTTWTNVSVTGTITATSFTSTASCGLYFTTNFESGVRYKIKYAYSTTATGGVRLMWRDGTGLGSAINSYNMSASGTLTATSDKAGFYINQNGSGTTTVTILSAEKILDDFIYNGNALLTLNADSSATYDNLPFELAPNNGEFVFNYTEKVVNGTFSSGVTSWTAYNGTIADGGGYALVVDNANYVRIEQGSVFNSSQYHLVTLKAKSPNRASQLRVYSGDYNTDCTTITNPTMTSSWQDYKFIVYGSSTSFRLRCITSAIGDTIYYDDISVSQLTSPTGWTASTMNATNYVIQDTEGLRLVSDGTTTYIQVNSIFAIGHKYRIKIIVPTISGSCQLKQGSGTNIRIINSANTYIDTIIADNANFQISKYGASCNAIISSLSITEVFTESSAKLPLPTQEYAWYEGSLSYQKVGGDASPIITFNDNTSFTLNPISATWQDTVLGFWGAVEDDYLSFDGVNDNVTVVNHSSIQFGETPFSFGAKFNTNNKTLSQAVISKYTATGHEQGYEIFITASLNLVKARWYDSSGNKDEVYFSTSNINNGVDYYVTAVRTDDSVFIYLDNVLMDSDVITYTHETTTANLGLGIRGSNSSLFLYGEVKRGYVFNKALNATEIDSLYKNTLTDYSDCALNLGGEDGNISSTTWTDASGNGNDGTISGCTLMQPPFLTWSTDDTCKVNLKINYIEQIADKGKVTKDNSFSIGLSTDISTVGSFVDNFTVHTTVGDYNGTVTSEVIPQSNVHEYPINFVASANISGIGFSWTDTNVPDTNLYLNQTFDVELEQDLLWTQNNSYSVVTSSADRLKITRGTSTSQYQSAWITFDDLQCYTQISLDAYIGTASKVCMVVYGYVDGSPTTISNQESTTDTTFIYNYDLTNFESIKVFAQIITTANGQYGTFDNFTIYNTSPSYDNWVLKLHNWLNGYMVNEWYIGATGTDGTSYLLTGLSDGDKKSGIVGFVYDTDTLWSDVDTATFHQTTISYGDPVAADYWIRNDVSNSWGTNGANAKDSTVCVNYDTLLAHLGDIDILSPVIAFRHNQNHLGYLEINGDDYPNLEGFTITSWMTDAKASVGVYGELEGWDNPDVWTNPVYDSDGATWKFVFADFPQYTFNDSLLIGRMIFDDTLETLAYVYSGMSGLSEAEVPFSTIAGKEYTYPNDKYRWSQYKYHPAWGGTAGANFQDYVYVWTPDSSKPSSYYSSIKIPQCIRSNAHARTTAMRFENLDDFTFKNIEISGGDQISVEVINCDNVTFDSVLVDKFSYDGLRFWSCYKPQIKNSVFLGYDSETLYSDSVHAEASAKQTINFLGDCDSVLVYNNYIESVSIQSISFYSNYVVEGSTGSGFGTSDDAIIWGNHIKNTTDRFYQRAFQFTCEVSGIDPDDLNNVAHNATIVGNLFEGLTVGNKCRVDTMLYAYNIWTGATKHWTYNIDHSIIREFDDGSFLDGAFQRSSHHYLINNTFVNGIEDLTSETINRNYITFGNNLFLGMNQVNQRGGADLYWNDNGRAIVFRNNYSYNVNDENKAIYIKPGGESGGDYDLSWYQLNSASLTNVTASGNFTSQAYVDDIDSCLTDWQNSDYNINLNNSYINQGGYDFSSLLPSWFTEDYYGNVIRKTSPNIGAVDNR